MKKSIYKITNLINGKSYIGQTNDFQRRQQEHKKRGYGTEGQKPLYYAFDKYGLENFSFEIIEADIENYNEREVYWINFYHTLVPNGYNVQIGGDEPPLYYGEDNSSCTHSDELVDQVIDLLKNSSLSIKEIGKRFNYDDSAIRRINRGELRHREDINYPIKKMTTQEEKEERALKIIDDLLFTNLTQKEIGKKYGLGRTAITAINTGQNYKQPELNYPLRKNSITDVTVYQYELNTNNLIQKFSTLKELSEKVNLNSSNPRTIATYLGRKLKVEKEVNAYGYTWTKYIK